MSRESGVGAKCCRPRRGQRGFTLLEALLALLLALLLFGGLAAYSNTWLGAWNRIIQDTSRKDNAAVVLDRIVEDLEETAAIFDETGIGEPELVFEGKAESVSFIRPALGFGPRIGFDRVTYRNGSSGDDPAILRIRRNFPDEGSSGEDLPLLRGSPVIRFQYAGAEGEFDDDWPRGGRLPSFIRVEITGQTPRRWQRSATAVIRVQRPAVCGASPDLERCRTRE